MATATASHAAVVVAISLAVAAAAASAHPMLPPTASPHPAASTAPLPAVITVASTAPATTTPNLRPIVGILAAPASTEGAAVAAFGSSYFPASYSRFFEGAGARVVPIPFDATPAQLSVLLQSVNGVVVPGGWGGVGDYLANKTLAPFIDAVVTAVHMARSSAAAGETWPVWGECLGYEAIVYAVSNSTAVFTDHRVKNVSLPLNITAAGAAGRILGSQLPDDVREIFATQGVTYNNHDYGVTPADWAASAALSSFFTVASVNGGADTAGTFVSTIEGRTAPVYGTQYHPEKNQFEWNPNMAYAHSGGAVAASRYLSGFMVGEARKNARAFASTDEEDAALLDNYAPLVTRRHPGFPTYWDAVYVFPPAKQMLGWMHE